MHYKDGYGAGNSKSCRDEELEQEVKVNDGDFTRVRGGQKNCSRRRI